ncbi:MAG: acyl-CoA carboxylase subunit epsilon [Leifsonia sp.]
MNLASPAEEPSDGIDPSEISFITRHVSPEQAAAVTAVLSSVLREESDLHRREPDAAADAWARSQRALRAPLTPGAGRWRSFDPTAG